MMPAMRLIARTIAFRREALTLTPPGTRRSGHGDYIPAGDD